MRSVSSLYFFFRLVTYLSTLFSQLLNRYFHTNKWLISGSLCSILSLFIALIKPYNKLYTNYLDAMLHLYVAISCFILSTGSQPLIVTRVLLWIPITFLFLILSIILFKKLQFPMLKIVKACQSKLNLSSRSFRSTSLTNKPSQNQQAYACNQTAAKPLIQPTSSVITYGSINDNVVSQYNNNITSQDI